MVSMVNADSYGVLIFSKDGNEYAYCQKNKNCEFLNEQNINKADVQVSNYVFMEVIIFILCLIFFSITLCYYSIMFLGKKFRILPK